MTVPPLPRLMFEDQVRAALKRSQGLFPQWDLPIVCRLNG